MPMRNVCALVLLGLVTSTGCSKDAEEPQPGASQGNEAPPEPVAPITGSVPMTKLTDGQIAQILATVDEGEIAQAEIALKKANNPAIREYATHMVQQHTASKQNGAQLASQASLTLGESPVATNLEAKSKQTAERLEATDAAGFDAAYLQAQIDQHAEVLTMIDQQLLPAVNEPALRDHLTSARGMVQHHLEQAQQIQKQ